MDVTGNVRGTSSAVACGLESDLSISPRLRRADSHHGDTFLVVTDCHQSCPSFEYCHRKRNWIQPLHQPRTQTIEVYSISSMPRMALQNITNNHLMVRSIRRAGAKAGNNANDLIRMKHSAATRQMMAKPTSVIVSCRKRTWSVSLPNHRQARSPRRPMEKSQPLSCADTNLAAKKLPKASATSAALVSLPARSGPGVFPVRLMKRARKTNPTPIMTLRPKLNAAQSWPSVMHEHHTRSHRNSIGCSFHCPAST